MRTLRKTLCLVLALVMVLGVCAVGATAVEFTDAAEINYDKAVAVLSSIGVITGIEVNGEFEFQPAGVLTRAQAATIIARLLQADENELSAKSPFTDCAGHWADGYIAYAASKGIVAGVGDNKYEPDAKLTGFAFAKMLLCALGYNAENEGMIGDSWAVAVATLAKKTGIINGISPFDGSAECTREQACQMAYNALFASLVVYKNGGTTITTGDVTITTGAAAAEKTGETLYKDGFGLSDEDDPDEMVNPRDAYGREAVLEIYDADGNVIYNEYPEADYIYYNASVEEQGKADVAKAYAKANGLKESDIKIVNWPGDYDVQPSPMPSFSPMAVLMSDPYAGYGPRPVFPDEYFEFTVSADKKTITFVTAYWYDYAAILDIKDTADKDAEYTKDIILTEYYENIICSLMSDNLYKWTVHEDELTVGEKGDWIAYIVNYLPDSMGNVNYKDAVVLSKNQGTVSAYNEATAKVTIGGKTLGIDNECVDPDYVFDPVDFKSVMDYYVSPNGKLAAILINTLAEEEYVTKVGYAVSCQSVAYGAASTGDLLGAGAAAAKDGRAVVKMLDMDGKTTIYDLAVVTDAVAGTTSFTGKDSLFTGVVTTEAESEFDCFVEYYVKEDGSIVIVACYEPDTVTTKKATVAVGSDKASSATVIKTVGDAASKYATAEIVGYKNFVDATYATAYVTYDKAGYIDTIYAVDVPAAPVVEAETIYYILAQGDQTAAGYEYTAIVDGKEETVVLANENTVFAGYYYTLAIANGVVTSATEKEPDFHNAVISAVDAAYIDTDAGVIEFAKTTATYDISGKNITKLAKDVAVDVFDLADGSQIIFIVGTKDTVLPII
ncbi:MAG: S-layer homology domain-containing protein [Oscillospiraceae bacterium]|nr:S-layer homology domain-containing protein [Oscillospiraceae bacterium]